VVYTFGCFIDPAFVSPRKGAYRRWIASRRSIRTPSVSSQGAVRIVSDSAGDAGRAERRGPELRDHPIGTGPYKFVSFAVDDHVELTAFPTTSAASRRTMASC
jgi:hypothetical protein